MFALYIKPFALILSKGYVSLVPEFRPEDRSLEDLPIGKEVQILQIIQKIIECNVSHELLHNDGGG